jgi:hypothetical protein
MADRRSLRRLLWLLSAPMLASVTVHCAQKEPVIDPDDLLEEDDTDDDTPGIPLSCDDAGYCAECDAGICVWGDCNRGICEALCANDAGPCPDAGT